jgi:hypothetical protein
MVLPPGLSRVVAGSESVDDGDMERRIEHHESPLEKSRRLTEDAQATQERLRLAMARLQRAVDEPLARSPSPHKRET